MKVLLIVNPAAGQQSARQRLAGIIRVFNEYDVRCSVYITKGPGDATEFLKKTDFDFDRVVCVGGDGTLHETVEGRRLSGRDYAVGYIPAGTTNDFASSLGLSSDMLTAAADSLKGQICALDTGMFNGRSFVYTATCGAFARTSYMTPQDMKNALGHSAYIVSGLMDLPHIRPMRLKVSADEAEFSGEYIFCSITNSLSVGGILKLDSSRVCMNDGKFELMLIRNPVSLPQWTRLLSSLRVQDIPNEMVSFVSANRFHIDAEENIEWTLDGEAGEHGRVFDIMVQEQALRMALARKADCCL